jgi:hypothetical protein
MGKRRCENCESAPCTCQKALAVHPWLIQHCSQPHCQTAIRVRGGQQQVDPVCKWCAGAAPTLGVVA